MDKALTPHINAGPLTCNTTLGDELRTETFVQPKNFLVIQPPTWRRMSTSGTLQLTVK